METVEQMIQRKDLNAPRVTPAMIEAEIAEVEFVVVGRVLTLKNGFKVTGESACASPENFDKEVGERVAREDAKGKIWPLLGFRLRDRLAGITCPEGCDGG